MPLSKLLKFTESKPSMKKKILSKWAYRWTFYLLSHAFNWISCNFMCIIIDFFYTIRKQVLRHVLCVKHHINIQQGKEKQFWRSIVILQSLVSNKFLQQSSTALASPGLLSGFCTTSLNDTSNLYCSSRAPKAVLVGKNLVRLNCQLLSSKDIRSDYILLMMTWIVLSLWLGCKFPGHPNKHRFGE